MLWIIFVIVPPFLGVFTYLIVNHEGMTQRSMDQAKAQMDDYVRGVASSGGGVAAEIENAKGLLDSGSITQAEFAAIKAKALASS